MKKIIAFALIAALMIGGTVTVHAATTAQRPCQTQECFADNNQDGICDNRADCQKDGACPRNGQNCPDGFVDADKDGTCDNRANCPAGSGINQTGSHHGGSGHRGSHHR